LKYRLYQVEGHDPAQRSLTGLEHPQPCAQEIDLSKPEEELLEALKVMTGQEICSIAI
jgi:hypothetical protein